MNIFEDIKQKLNFETVANEYGLHFKNKKTLCPFHNEKIPSFSLFPDGRGAKCFGCEKIVDVIDLEMVLGGHGTQFKAAKALIEKFNLSIDVSSKTDRNVPEEYQKLMDLYVEKTHKNLLNSSDIIESIEREKGITNDQIKEHKIGYVGRGVFASEITEGSIQAALELGLIIKKEDGKIYDRFQNRLLFPIYDQGKIISIWSRQYPGVNANFPKWMGLQNNIHCPNKPVVFIKNLNKEYCIVTESIPDSLALIRAGYPSTCILGKEISEANSHFFRSTKSKVFFMLDADDAGRVSARKLAIEYKGYYAPIDFNKDLEKAYLELGKEKFKKLIEEAMENSYSHKNLIEEDRILSGSDEKREIHPIMDLIENKFIYGLSSGNVPFYLMGRKTYSLQQMKEIYSISVEPRICNFSKKGIKRFLKGPEINPFSTYMKIKELISDYIIFKEDWQLDVIIVWIFGTYIYRCFPLFPYLWIHSPTKRCGKTKLLELMSSLSFNSAGIQTAPTEAVLFREPSRTGSTLLWDEAENFQSNQSKGERHSVLNAAYRRSGIVDRCQGDDHKVVSFNVFRPIALAGISNMPDTIKDRSIQIELVRKSSSVQLKQLQLNKLELKSQDIRDELFAFGLEHAHIAVEAYESFLQDLIPATVTDDRLRDNIQVLMSIANAIINKTEDISLIESLQKASTSLVPLRIEGEEELSYVKAIKILQNVFYENEDDLIVYNSKEAYDLFSIGGIEWIETSQKAAGFIRNKFGKSSESHTIKGQSKRGYRFERNEINKLYEAYFGEQSEEMRDFRDSVMISEV